MTRFNTKPDRDFSALAVKRDAKIEEKESLTGFIEQMQALLKSAESTEQMQALLKSMEDRKTGLEEKIAYYQEEMQSYQGNN